MTFNEANVNRKEDGKFGEKVGSAPETALRNNAVLGYLDDARNGFGAPLSPDARADVLQFFDDPSHERWVAARNHIISPHGRDMTVWQLTVANSEFKDADPDATPTREDVVDALEQRFGRTERSLSNGDTVQVPNSIGDRFRGVNVYGELVIENDYENRDGTRGLMALTPCCNASAKGSEYGIVCRACYNEVDPALGGEQEPEDVIPVV